MVVGSSSTPNLSFIGIVDFSQEARWIYMTESVTDLLGYEPRDLVGRPSLELVHPDEFPRVKQLHYDTIRQDKAAVLVYLRMKHKDPLKGYVLCGVSRTVVHDVLVGSVSFANPNKALQNASTAQEITVIAPEARNFQFRRWHDPSPMPPSPIPEPMRVLPAAFLNSLEQRYGAAAVAGMTMSMGGMNGMGGTGMGMGGGAAIEYVDIPDRRYGYAPSPPRSPSPPPAHQQRYEPSAYATAAAKASYRSPPAHASVYDQERDRARDDRNYQRDYDYGHDRDRNDYDDYNNYPRTAAPLPPITTTTSAHHNGTVAPQESYARRRSPSYADSPVYTPASPYASSASADESVRRRLSGSSSSSSSSSSGSGSGPGSRVGGGASGGYGANGARGAKGVNGNNGVTGSHANRDLDDIDRDDDAGSGRRLGHSTSWTRRRVGSVTPTPPRLGDEVDRERGGGRERERSADEGRQRDRDVDMDGYRDMHEDEEDRRRDREREMARDLEEETSRYRERYPSPEVRYRERERDRYTSPDLRDLATNRYYSPALSSSSPPTSNGGTNGYGRDHGYDHEHEHRNGDARGHSTSTNGMRHAADRSLTPSPPRSAYSRANGPASPTYASIARGSPPRRQYTLPPLSPCILNQPLSSPPPAAPAPPHLPPLLPAPRVPASRPRDPSPVITFDHLPAQSSRTAFILDRFTDKSSIMYCSNTLLICPASPSAAGSPSLGAAAAASSSPVSPTAQRRSGSPPHNNKGRSAKANGNRGANGHADGHDDLAQANAIGRPFYDFVAPRDEQTVRDWIACVKGWGVNEKGQPSDGGFGFGRFGLVKEGRESAPRNPDPALTSRGGRNRRGSMSGRGRTPGASRRGIDQNGRRRPGGNSSTSASAANAGGSSPPYANGGDSDPEREAQRQRQREAEVTVIQVDAIFSAHSDGLMVILRRAI